MSRITDRDLIVGTRLSLALDFLLDSKTAGAAERLAYKMAQNALCALKGLDKHYRGPVEWSSNTYPAELWKCKDSSVE